jgi:hypothetical protein
MRGSVTNNGLWTGRLELLTLLLHSQPIITAHSQWLRLAPFLTGPRASSLLRDWLGSDLRIGHFFSFRCPLVSTPQLNTRLPYDWTTTLLRIPNEESFATELSWTELTSRRSEYRSPSPTVRVTLCFIRCHGNVCLARRWIAVGFFVAAWTFVTEPLPSNGHIHHNI